MASEDNDITAEERAQIGVLVSALRGCLHLVKPLLGAAALNIVAARLFVDCVKKEHLNIVIEGFIQNLKENIELYGKGK